MADDDENAGVKDFARKLKGLDTSQVEVDDEQAPPAFAADSPEEAARLAELEAEIARSGVAERWQTFSAASGYDELPLWCLRGRKYDVVRAAELLPRLMDLIEELEIGGGDQERIMADLQTLKFVGLGTKDAHGRAILWVRMRFHDPKVSKPRDMARLFTTVLLNLLRDADVQRMGVAVVSDARGAGLSNLDAGIPKMIFGKVFPNLPIRVGRMVIFNPPWIIGNVLFPIIQMFLSAKLKERLAMIKDKNTDRLLEYFPQSALPEELGGTGRFDAQAFVASISDDVVLVDQI